MRDERRARGCLTKARVQLQSGKPAPFANTAKSAAPGKARTGRAIAAWVVVAIVAVACGAGLLRASGAPSAKSRAHGSELSVVAADVQLLLIARNGKETGYDPRTKKQVREIPGASYFEDALAAFDSGRVDTSTTQTLQVRRPQAGKYRLVISPGNLADGEGYEVRVKLYRRDGSEAANARIDGTVKRGEAVEYEVELRAGRAGAARTIRVVRVTAARRVPFGCAEGKRHPQNQKQIPFRRKAPGRTLRASPRSSE